MWPSRNTAKTSGRPCRDRLFCSTNLTVAVTLAPVHSIFLPNQQTGSPKPLLMKVYSVRLEPESEPMVPGIVYLLLIQTTWRCLFLNVEKFLFMKGLMISKKNAVGLLEAGCIHQVRSGFYS